MLYLRHKVLIIPQKMKRLSFSADMEHINNHLNVKLSMYVFKEDGMYIVYCPALDMSACGKTEQEAQKDFEDVFEISMKYMLNKNTLKKDLINHGWEIKSLKQKKYKTPSFEQLIDNDYFADILNNKEYSKYDRQVEIPQIA